jgi:hypothetical protein
MERATGDPFADEPYRLADDITPEPRGRGRPSAYTTVDSLRFVLVIDRELNQLGQSAADHKAVVTIIEKLISADDFWLNFAGGYKNDAVIEQLRQRYCRIRKHWKRLWQIAEARGISLLDSDVTFSI